MWATMKYVSAACQSNGTAAVITPLIPPSVNCTMNPSANNIDVVSTTRPCHIVAIQAKIVTALGMETVMLAAEKKVIDNWDMPVENMWCTHTPNPTSPVMTVESATSSCPI